MLRLLAASAFLVFAAVFADPYDCHGDHAIDPPKNLSEAWHFPTGWDDSGAAPQFAANQRCTWKFNVPKGMFAFLTVTASTDVFTVALNDSIGNTDWISVSASRDPYFLLDPGFTVDLDARTVGNLGMRVLWTKMGPFQPVSHQMMPNDVPFVLSSGAFDNGTVISSASRVSLVSLPPPSSFLDLAPYMRNTVVFDGPTLNDKLLGNLWQIYDSGNHLVSSGKYLTMYSLMPNVMLNNYALLQDYQNVQGFSTYKGVMCYTTTLCPVSIDARNGSGAAVRMSGTSHYLREVQIPNMATLDVYTGALVNGNKLRRYSNDQIKTTLPQEFQGLFTTYVVKNGIGVVQLSYSANDAKWNDMFDGRNGLLVSKNFGTSSSDQSISESFSAIGSNKYKITLNVKDAGLVGDATLTVTVTDGKKTVMNTKYTSGQLNPDTTIVSNGNGLNVVYDTKGSKTTGMKAEFTFQNGAFAAGYGILLMVLTAVWTSIC